MAAAFPKSFVLNDKPIKPGVFPEGDGDLKQLLTNLEIYVSRADKFVARPRDIFKKEVLQHRTAKEANEWLARPNMRYWDQQLNYAVYCATTACGISFEDHLLMKGRNPQITSLMRFHVYYTIRRILNEMGAALPDSTVFNQLDNPYDHQKYNQICKEFGLSGRQDFRFKEGPNKGLGYTWTTGGGDRNTIYNGHDFFLTPKDMYYKSGLHKIRRQDTDRARIYLMQNTDAVGQYNRFVARKGAGLTKPGLARLSDSICAYVYCILGAQARVRSPITGATGGALLAQKQFLVLLEDLLSENESYTMYGRFQDTITETKVKLDMAISPNLYLLPSRMIIETGPAVVGYNNKLKNATANMKFGYNDDVNTERLESAAAEMEGEVPKIVRAAAEDENQVKIETPAAQAAAPEHDPIHTHMKTGLLTGAVLVTGIVSSLIYS